METSDDTDPRFIEEGNMIIFPMANCRVYITWKDKFEGMTVPQARRTIKRFHSHRAQDEMIHYLKAKGIVRNNRCTRLQHGDGSIHDKIGESGLD